MRKEYLHISFDTDTMIKKFVPSIPESRAGNEDDQIERICVSDTVEGCLKAHPYYWYEFISKLDTEYFDPYEFMEKLTYVKSLDKSGLLVNLYTFVIDESVTHMTNGEIIENCLVPDADETGETWILEEIAPTDCEYILITNFKKYEYIRLGGSIGETESEFSRFDRSRRMGE